MVGRTVPVSCRVESSSRVIGVVDRVVFFVVGFITSSSSTMCNLGASFIFCFSRPYFLSGGRGGRLLGNFDTQHRFYHVAG